MYWLQQLYLYLILSCHFYYWIIVFFCSTCCFFPSSERYCLLVDPFLIRRLWIEERNREETEDRFGRISSEYCNKIPEFIIHSLFIPQWKGENTRLPWYKEQAGIIICLHHETVGRSFCNAWSCSCSPKNINYKVYRLLSQAYY